MSRLKLSYNESLAQVELTITRSLVLKYKFPLQEIFEHCINILMQKQKEGSIIGSAFYFHDLYQLWALLRNDSSLADEETCHLVIASAFPRLLGFITESSSQINMVAEITIASDISELKKWTLEYLTSYLEARYELKIEGFKVNTADLHCLLERARNGENIENRSVRMVKEERLVSSSKDSYSLLIDHKREQITLFIWNVSFLATELKIKSFLDLIEEKIINVSKKFKVSYSFLRENLKERFKLLNIGPERFGFRLPVIFLAGLKIKKKKSSWQGINSYQGAGVFKIRVNQAYSEAYIDDFDKTNLEKWQLSDEAWILNELSRYNLPQELTRPFLAKILKSIDTETEWKNLQVARGKESQIGKRAYIQTNRKEFFHGQVSSSKEKKKTNTLTNNFVKSGEYLGFVNYSVLPRKSLNVYGFPLLKKGEKIVPSEVKVGPDIYMSLEQKFYAAKDGVPQIELQKINLNRIFTYEGEWNSACGDLIFDGDCEIVGSIEGRVKIRVSGNLKVSGLIQGASILCGKDLNCLGAVITGQDGYLKVSGNIYANFVENSILQSNQSIIIEKSIINSKVVAKGAIVIQNTTSGLISGGLINAQEYVQTAYLGSKEGSKTKVFVGENWLVRSCLDRRIKRLEKLSSLYEREDRSLNDLKSKSQLLKGIKKFEIKKKMIEEKVKKLLSIIEKLKIHIKLAEGEKYKNPSSLIIVKRGLAANCELTVSGQSLFLQEEHRNVALIRNKHHGKNVAFIDTDYAEEIIHDSFRKAAEE